MKTKKVTVPLVTHRDAAGNITHDYIEIPVTVYEQWLKKCYDLNGN